MSVSKEQWAKIKTDLSCLYIRVYLQCDDYLITAVVKQSKMKLSILVYVNGWLKGADLWHGKASTLAEMGDVPRRFYHLSSKGPTAKVVALSLALWGKKGCKEKGCMERYYSAIPEFSTPGAFIAHIKKHNPSIEVLDADRYRELLDQQRALEADHG